MANNHRIEKNTLLQKFSCKNEKNQTPLIAKSNDIAENSLNCKKIIVRQTNQRQKNAKCQKFITF